MDEAMAKLATAVEAHTAKAVADALAANEPDPNAGKPEQEAEDAAKVAAFADTLNPPAE